MATLSTFNASVATRVPDVDDIMPSAKRDEAVAAAVALWSKHRPQVLLTDIAGDGSTYDLTLPAAYDIHTSYVQQVEYPAGNRRPTYVDADNWSVYRSDSSTAKLRLYASTPGSTETVRITYTTVHVVDGSGSTIDANDEDAVSDLAASYLCEWVSTHYSQSSDGSLVVDSRDYKSQAAEYAMRAKRYRQLALDHLGIDAGGSGRDSGSRAAAVGVIKDFDSQRMDGSIRLTHPQR